MPVRYVFLVLAAISFVACSKARTPSGEQADNGPSAATVARCTGCHGDPANGNAAPPRSVQGDTATTNVRVGAHQSHLQPSAIRQAIDCSECHVVPESVDAPGHIDKAVADLSWGPLASAAGVTPTPAVGAAPAGDITCTNYCHGGAFAAANGALHTPSWTKVDGTQAGCGTCHGVPPPPPHPAVSNITACVACHAATIDAQGVIDVAGGKHINGLVDISGAAIVTGPTCALCHGDVTRTPDAIAPAPPKDTRGNTAETAPGVGAHLRHLTGGAIRSAITCGDCHPVPTDLSHINGQVDFAFSPLARTAAVAAAFNPATLKCATYCHGPSNWGGSNTTPLWTGGQSQAACGTCHGLPPPQSIGHPLAPSDRTFCGNCHPGTVKADGTIDVASGNHINGTVERTFTTCTACHGDATRANLAIAPAPPRDTKGGTTTASPGVGAHQAHLTAQHGISAPVGCGECHVVPVSVAHADQHTLPVFNGIGKAFNTTASFTESNLTCAVFCHGGGGSMKLTDGSAPATPVWNAQTDSAITCGACHGLPPQSGKHQIPQHTAGGTPFNCGFCHGEGYTSSTVVVATHVNGTKDVDAGPSAPALRTWVPPTSTTQGTCTAICHTPQTVVRSW